MTVDTALLLDAAKPLRKRPDIGECVVVDIATSTSSARLIRVLSRQFDCYGELGATLAPHGHRASIALR